MSRTRTPGSVASASASVALEMRGSRTTATRSHSVPHGGAGPAEHPPVRQRVLRVEPEVEVERQHAVASAARSARASMSSPGCQQRRASPRNLLMTKPATSAWSAGVEQRHGAEQGGEHAAPVDVADHDRRQVRPPGPGPC